MKHDREMTPFEQAVADHYNSCTPKEQRALDLRLAQQKARLVADPNSLFHFFPSLGTKTLKLKEPK